MTMRLLVACSGGPDSLALAAGEPRVARRTGRSLAAVIIDHGLQPGSATVAAGAGDQLSERGLAGRGHRRRGDRFRRRPGGRCPDARYAALHAAADRPPRPRCCSGTPWTTRPRRCCSGWPAGPGPGRWPAWRSAPARLLPGRCSSCAARRPRRPAPSSA